MEKDVVGVGSTEQRQLQIVDLVDGRIAQETARQVAKGLGFHERDGEEIVIAVSELASNLIRHAGGGCLTFTPLEVNSQAGIKIESQDRGPGILSFDQAIVDGYSSGGGLGLGLGTVNRLMDEMEVHSTPGVDTRIICRRWVRCISGERTSKWDVGVATQSRHFAQSNGDAFVIKEWGNSLLVGLIDGLGHGEAAEEAALAAKSYVLAHFDRPLDTIFAGAGRACRATRGVGMALASFESATLMRFATTGNIEARAWCSQHRTSFCIQRGIVGASQPKVTVQEHPWDPAWLLILHSDGLDSRWHWEDFVGFKHEPAQMIARRFIQQLSTREDDATVVVVRK